jgi:hypothetical protein
MKPLNWNINKDDWVKGETVIVKLSDGDKIYYESEMTIMEKNNERVLLKNPYNGSI